MTSKKKIIGLTGGIACGKNTVAEMFREFGAHIIDADLVVHQLLKDDPDVKREIVSIFGESVLNNRGEIDRSELGSIVFGNPDLLEKLNEIIHPRVAKLMDTEARQKLSSDECKAVVLNVPLLIEAGLTHTVDVVVLVYADEDTQIERLAKRGMKEEDARKRIGVQMPSSEKAKFADYIINNNGSLSDTARQVKGVWCEMFSEKKA